MTDIVVLRGAGDKDGGEIFDPMACTLEAALLRGRFEIEDHTPKVTHDVELVYAPTIACGHIIRIVNLNDGSARHGLVTGFSHVRDGDVTFTRADVEIPREPS